MEIIPPGLTLPKDDRYYQDFGYREAVDNELIGERRLRLALLFNPDITYEIDY